MLNDAIGEKRFEIVWFIKDTAKPELWSQLIGHRSNVGQEGAAYRYHLEGNDEPDWAYYRKNYGQGLTEQDEKVL